MKIQWVACATSSLILLAGCGSGDNDDAARGASATNSLRPADEINQDRTDSKFATVALGEYATLEVPPVVHVEGQESDPVTIRATVNGLKTGGDEVGPWLTVGVRVENTGGDDQSFPTFALVCDGSEPGGYQAGSTAHFGDTLPGGSFKKATLNLLLPGDGRYGQAVPLCRSPAFVRAYAEEEAGGGQWSVPLALIRKLNAKRQM